jgi:tubulin epsilon
MSSFFRNVDLKKGGGYNLPIGSEIQALKARAVIVDTEEGVIKQLLKSELGELFDSRHFIQDVSGAGNNWAHGYNFYGPKYEEALTNTIRKSTEMCDSLQGFFLMHSLGGGTGSGVGSYILSLLDDNFPEVFRFTTSVFPSSDDDVITSPYNSILSLNQLQEHADCVLPIDNQALLNICRSIETTTAKSAAGDIKQENMKIKGSGISEMTTKEEKPFDKMNNIVAHLLTNITSSMRFEGPLNVDLNEITMNLVPYPNIKFLLSSMAPLYSLADVKMLPRQADQMFKDIYADSNQVICASPLKHKYMAMGFLVRGDLAFTDVVRNIQKIKDEVNMVYWNTEGFKYGICNFPPIGQPYNVLCLSNNTCIQSIFDNLLERFNKLYKRKAHVHHYTEYIEQSLFDESARSTLDLIKTYQEMECIEAPKEIPRLKPLI